nr:hypothetical protein [Neisseria meningitidis]
MPRKQLY